MNSLALSLWMALASATDGSFVTSDGVRLHYLEQGRGSLILLVPGWTMPAWIWEEQLRALGQAHHVAALDPRSQGESDKALTGHDILRRARDIKEWMEHVGGGRPVLAGWSMGGSEILAYLKLFGPGGLRGAVLVDAPVGGSGPPSRSLQDRRERFISSIYRNQEAAMRSFVFSMFKNPREDAWLSRLIRDSLKTPAEASVNLLRSSYDTPSWEPPAEALDLPLVCAVTKSRKGDAEYLMKKAPRLRAVIFEDCGHALFVDDPLRFDQVLLDFVEGLPSEP